MISLTDLLEKILSEQDPKVGTGKKPKGSGRRLYTDEDPTDTVKIKFKTVQDIKDTFAKSSFKSKSHARKSQIINLIHQRVRAAYNRSKDPEVKARLKRALEYAEQKKEASKKKTERLRAQKENLDPKTFKNTGEAGQYGSGYSPVKEIDEKINCKGCNHSWDYSTGGDEPYLCHKCGADNTPQQLDEKCWRGYKQKGMKTMFGKKYPNCVKK